MTDTKNYPQLINAEIAEKCAHITDEVIAADIADTQREIDQYKALRTAEQEVAKNHPLDHERRLAAFRASARDAQIDERERFIAFLTLLQTWRKEHYPVRTTETGRFTTATPNMTEVDRA